MNVPELYYANPTNVVKRYAVFGQLQIINSYCKENKVL